MRKYLHKNKTKMNIPICVAAVLFCLTLVSTYFVSGLFARYAASDESSDSARVAKFSIEGSGIISQPIEEEVIPGKTVTKELIIENNSEVAVEYTIEVTNVTKNLPLQFSMKKVVDASGEQEINIPFTEQKLPGSHTDSYTLHINWPGSADDITRTGMVDYITVKVTAIQID